MSYHGQARLHTMTPLLQLICPVPPLHWVNLQSPEAVLQSSRQDELLQLT